MYAHVYMCERIAVSQCQFLCNLYALHNLSIKELHKSTAHHYHAGATEIYAWTSPLGVCAIGYGNSTIYQKELYAQLDLL